MLYVIAAVAAIVLSVTLGLNLVARRSGMTIQELSSVLPGDYLIKDPGLIIDRATTLDAEAKDVWPWIVQLGKERGGWYAPAWVERFTRRFGVRGIREIDERFQELAVGDHVPDWGPGKPTFKVAMMEPPCALVYLSLRDPSSGWGWPASDAMLNTGIFGFSWALLLENTGAGKCRLYIRLRAKRQGTHFSRSMFLFGGTVDYITIKLMFAGLKERLNPPAIRK